MEQGCPHRSILPHIFPDCNSFAIKIGGKFCGVRGVCPGGGLAPALPARQVSAVPGGGRACFVACLHCHCGARGGACLLCRLPTLPLAYFFAPIPPAPFPAGRGRPRLFYARGFAPCIPGAEPGRHWSRGRTTHPAGVCLRNCQLAAKPIEQPFYWQCRQPRRGGTGGDGTIRRTRRRRLRWSSPPGQG